MLIKAQFESSFGYYQEKMVKIRRGRDGSRGFYEWCLIGASRGRRARSSRGVRGHAPPQKCLKIDVLKYISGAF